MQLKVKKHELRLLLQCIPILTFATLASLGSLLPSVVQFSAAVILAGQVVFIFGTNCIKKNIVMKFYATFFRQHTVVFHAEGFFYPLNTL